MGEALPDTAKSPVREGDVVAGKYRVDRVLGAGGMGIVVAARHVQLDQRVALKFLLSNAVTGVETLHRFLREAKAAVMIQSEHVARVLDFGSLDDGTPYVVMEYLEGKDLAAVLEERGPLPLADAVGCLLQACEAFAEAHAAGIVHRDIKPSNLFLAKRGAGMPTVKVLDFGISKLSSSPEATKQDVKLTSTTAVMGSPLYMSPEQMASSKNVDARADIWSIGVTLYELLAGHAPFGGDTVTELITRVLSAPLPSIRKVRPDIPPEFEAVLDRALRKSRDERYADVAQLAAALAPFAPRWALSSVEHITTAFATVPAAAAPGASRSEGRRLDVPASSPNALLERQPRRGAETDLRPHGGGAIAMSPPAPDSSAAALSRTELASPAPDSSAAALSRTELGPGLDEVPAQTAKNWGSTQTNPAGVPARGAGKAALWIAVGLTVALLAGGAWFGLRMKVPGTTASMPPPATLPMNTTLLPSSVASEGTAAVSPPASASASTVLLALQPLTPAQPAPSSLTAARRPSLPPSPTKSASPAGSLPVSTTSAQPKPAPSDHVGATDSFGN